MNRKLRCSKRQVRKITSKLGDDSVSSILRNHRLTAREQCYMESLRHRFRTIFVSYERDLYRLLGIPMLRVNVAEAEKMRLEHPVNCILPDEHCEDET